MFQSKKKSVAPRNDIGVEPRDPSQPFSHAVIRHIEENPTEGEHLMADHTKYGDEQYGEYCGISYSAQRSDDWGYWRAHIHLDEEIPINKITAMDAAAHQGLTGKCSFECSHRGDFPVDPHGEYRDYQYVLEHVKAVIDVICS